MIIKKELIKLDIAGDTVLVPVGKSVLENNGLYALNEVASFIWDILPVVNTQEEIVKKLLDEYDIDEKTAREDCEVFLQKLKEMNIL